MPALSPQEPLFSVELQLPESRLVSPFPWIRWMPLSFPLITDLKYISCQVWQQQLINVLYNVFIQCQSSPLDGKLHEHKNKNVVIIHYYTLHLAQYLAHSIRLILKSCWINETFIVRLVLWHCSLSIFSPSNAPFAASPAVAMSFLSLCFLIF